jgi:divalent metal cation (Fe/Co/Zn/Cd) transporter
LSLFIIYDWGATALANVIRLSGSAVADRLQKKVAYLCFRFAPLVDGFKSIKSYHAGDGVWTECDLLMPERTQLGRAHDIAETLQYCCEALREVDRAFVSTDCKLNFVSRKEDTNGYTDTVQGPTGHAEQ